jgi:hypothetical protein
MTEFVLGFMLSTAALFGAAGALRAEWDRVRCSYLAFEAAHAALTRSRARPDSRVRVMSDERGVGAQGTCRAARERVEFYWLDGDPHALDKK